MTSNNGARGFEMVDPYVDEGGWGDEARGSMHSTRSEGIITTGEALDDFSFDSQDASLEMPSVSAVDDRSPAVPAPESPQQTVERTRYEENHKVCQVCRTQAAIIYCSLCAQLCGTCSSSKYEHFDGHEDWEKHNLKMYRPGQPVATDDHSEQMRNLIRQTLSPQYAKNKKERRKLHRLNRETLWFAVKVASSETDKTDANTTKEKATPQHDEAASSDHKSTPSLKLEEYERFKQVINEYYHTYEVLACYPRLISFIGDTGAGKSGLIALLIEYARQLYSQMPAPVSETGRTLPLVGDSSSTEPTSGNVHLYYGGVVEDEKGPQPLLYADCEGFRGSGTGEFMTADEEEEGVLDSGTQAHQEASAGPSIQRSELSKTDGKEASKSLGSKIVAAVAHTFRTFSRMLQPSMTKRSTAVDEMFPRLLYNFSDVIIYVVSHQSQKSMGETLNKLVGWSDSSHEAAINRLILPHLIIVINKCPKGSDWKQELATETILQEQAGLLTEDTAGTRNKTIDQLNKSYASVQFLNMPNMADTKPRIEQLKDLYSLIVKTAKTAQQKKAEVGMALPSRSLHQFYKLAFEHYSKTLDEPFNFIQSLAEAQPPVKSLVDSFLTIMKAAKKTVDGQRRERTQEKVNVFMKSVAPVICSTIAVLISRDNEKLEARMQLQAMFKGDDAANDAYRRKDEKGDKKKRLEITYQSHVQRAFERFLDSLPCEFKDDKGLTCVNSRQSHQSLNQHNSATTGKRLTPGPFESAFATLLESQWHVEVDLALRALESAFETASAVQRQANTWKAHLENLNRLFEKLQGLRLYHFSACAWCLRGESEEMLPCRHGMCNPCARRLTGPSPEDDREFIIRSCHLHSQHKQFEPRVSILIVPQQIGRRILSLDATGVRGMVTLRILAGLEQRLGGKLPISAFFDLIGGTGVGGMLALALGVRGQTAQAFIPHMETHLRRTFFKWSLFSQSYDNSELHNSVDNLFSGKLQRTLMGLRELEGKNSGTKVFVTAAVNGDTEGAIISNYARPSSPDEPYKFDYEPDGVEPLTLQVAARVTNALPQYLPPVVRRGSRKYTDGSPSALSNPASVALREAHSIWPLVKDRGPDILVSVGAGLQENDTWYQWWTHWGTLSKKLLKERNTDERWQKSRSTFQPSDQAASVRLNPTAEREVPNPDDVKQFGAGQLRDLVEQYFTEHTAAVDAVAWKLFATTFYFHATKLPEINEHLVRGFIMCRFIHGSEEMSRLVETLKEMRNPRIEYDDENGKTRVLMKEHLPTDEANSRLRIPINLRLSKDQPVEVYFATDEAKRQLISGFPTIPDDYFLTEQI